jgi:hypothetical protein
MATTPPTARRAAIRPMRLFKRCIASSRKTESGSGLRGEKTFDSL